MTEELSSTINIVLVIFFIVAVVAIVLMLIGIVKNMIGVGVMKFQGSASAIMDSQFADYDQRVIGGVLVKNAIQQFQGQDVGIIVKTSVDDNGKPDSAQYGRNYGALISTNTVTATTPTQIADGAGGAPAGLGIEYRPAAALGKANPTDSYYTAIFFKGASGEVLYNLNTKSYNQSGYAAYIRDSAMFRASLILDPSGTKIGIYCEQIG
jgi:hypothetical protein